MNKLNEIKAFIEKSTQVMSALARVSEHSFLYSGLNVEEIIEQQQDLRRHARRIGVISVDKPYFEEADFTVLINFSEFRNIINLDECKVKKLETTVVATRYHYSIIVENIVLCAIENVSNEEHKKAQAI